MTHETRADRHEPALPSPFWRAPLRRGLRELTPSRRVFTPWSRRSATLQGGFWRRTMLTCPLLCLVAQAVPEDVYLLTAVIIAPAEDASAPERTAVRVFAEEIERRTRLRLAEARKPLADRPCFVFVTRSAAVPGALAMPDAVRRQAASLGAEGFHVALEDAAGPAPRVWVVGADPLGVLFGAGWLLRKLDLETGSIYAADGLSVTTSPRYPLRGHQLGYRGRANSYDAWDAARFEQHIRELTFFGVNAIENIPFEGEDGPHMPIPRRAMNRAMSEICSRYGLQYWVWVPADFDLSNDALRKSAIEAHEALYGDCPRLDALFFPGGDPGNNHPRLVMPFLEEIAARLVKRHPRARIWISLQGFDREEVDFFFDDVARRSPAWLGGVVYGPSSPPIDETRRRLPERYGLRHYPDITHTVRCQYPVPWWDPAFAHTLGREPINPRPLHQAQTHNLFAPYTTGFITYSDGVHDDLNKTVWSARGWDPDADVREIVADYARVFLHQGLAPRIADAIFALERNWEGSLAENGGVEGTLALVESIYEERTAEALVSNWRWYMIWFRAAYDAHTRNRLIRETALEKEANSVLLRAGSLGAEAAMREALAVLDRRDRDPDIVGLRTRVALGAARLFELIGLQLSVPDYKASGAERGAVLDFLDRPLNNRWWLEDQFTRTRTLASEEEKVQALKVIAEWEHPGPGSFYDEVGNVAKSPHVRRGEGNLGEILQERVPTPDVMWWDDGRSRQRLSWISFMNWPVGLRYEGLDPKARYVLRMTGYGEALVRVDGDRVAPTLYGKGIGELKEFDVPQRCLADGRITVTFDRPSEPGVNWRQQSRLNEVWLLRIVPPRSR